MSTCATLALECALTKYDNTEAAAEERGARERDYERALAAKMVGERTQRQRSDDSAHKEHGDDDTPRRL